MNVHKLIIALYDLFEIGGPPIERGIPYTSFGMGSDPISIIGGENIIAYNKIIGQLHSSDTDIFQSYSRKSFANKLIEYICPLKISGVVPTAEQTEAFYAYFKVPPIRKFRVFREIYGITLKDPTIPLNLGNFTIYDFELYKEMNKESLDPTFIQKDFKFIIEYNAKSREEQRAVEIVDEYFKRFILFLRYIIGNPDDRFEVGILDFMGSRGRRAVVLSEGTCYITAERCGLYEPIPLDDKYFVNNGVGYDVLWGFIDNTNLNSIQKRILTAVEWIGRSLAEKTIQAAFIEASVALESIFTYSEKTIITPSILNQISEGVAFILKKSTNEGLEIESQIKALYGIRSGIVHAGDKEIDKKDYGRFVQYIRSVIASLITNEEFNKCCSVDEMYKVLKRMKYA